jgi:hypothetical protein
MRPSSDRLKRVTVVVGAYGKPLELKKTLTSLVNQLEEELCVLVIDDNCPSSSTIIEDTKKVVVEFSDVLDITLIKNPTRVGVPSVFRKWVESVNTEFFMLYGDGDVMISGALRKLLNCLDNNPSSIFAHGREVNTPKHIKPTSGETLLISSKKYLESSLIGGRYAWSQMACLLRTEPFKLKTEVVKDWYWDHYFHCQLHLFSDEVCFLDEFIVVRDPNVEIVNSALSANKIFRHHTERKLQSLDFIDRYERILLYKKIPINYYRARIVGDLITKVFFIGSMPKQMLIFRKIVIEISRMVASAFILLLLYPLTLLTSSLALKVINMILKKN